MKKLFIFLLLLTCQAVKSNPAIVIHYLKDKSVRKPIFTIEFYHLKNKQISSITIGLNVELKKMNDKNGNKEFIFYPSNQEGFPTGTGFGTIRTDERLMEYIKNINSETIYLIALDKEEEELKLDAEMRQLDKDIQNTNQQDCIIS